MNAIDWIERLLKEGHCDSRVEDWMNEVRAHSEGFYQRTKAERGVEAAEAELARVVTKRNYRTIAGFVKPIVMSIGKLAKTGDKKGSSVLIIENTKDLRFPARSISAGRTGKLIVAWNSGDHYNWGMCSSDERTNLEVWLPRGSLKLRAVTIAFSVFDDTIGEDLDVGLVFDKKERLWDEHYVGGDEFVVITLRADGTIRGDTVAHAVTKGSALRLALGFGDGAPEILQSCGGDIERHLGFLGSHDYLLKHLPGLPQYLSEVAKLQEKKE
jgi:hypothetical protein